MLRSTKRNKIHATNGRLQTTINKGNRKKKYCNKTTKFQILKKMLSRSLSNPNIFKSVASYTCSYKLCMQIYFQQHHNKIENNAQI